MSKPVNASSEWSQTSDLDFVYGTFNQVKLIGNGDSASLRLDLEKDWIRQYPTKPPSVRRDLAMAPVWDTDKIVLFGGLRSSYYLNDTWIFDSTNNTWTRKSTSTSPLGRYGHAMATIYGTDKVLMFGGYDKYQSYSEETWTYDLSENTWTQMFPPKYPQRRQYHSMASIYGFDKVLLFGGEQSNWSCKTGTNDTWIYDFSINHWAQLNLNHHPLPCIYHKMASIPGTDKVMLFGGRYLRNFTTCPNSSNNDTYKNYHLRDDTWIFDLSDESWTNVTQPVRPRARAGHALATIWDSDRILLYGGLYDINNTTSDLLDDTWLYNFNLNHWQKLNLENGPPPLVDHSMATIYGSDKSLLFGGYNCKNYNESWIFNLYFNLINGTYTSPPYDIGIISSFYSISWDAVLPEDTIIKFQLRSGLNKAELVAKHFIGPDGNESTYYNVSEMEIWSGHNGAQWIQYKAYFKSTNKEELAELEEVTISFNRHPRSMILSPGNLTEISENKPVFKWHLNDDSSSQRAFQVLIDNEITFEVPNYDSGIQIRSEKTWQFPSGTAYSILPDGEWYWEVRTKNSEGTWGPFSKSAKFIIDTKPPNSRISEPFNNGSFNYLTEIIGIAYDNPNGVGVIKVEVSIKRLNDNYYWSDDNIGWVSKETWILATGSSEWFYDAIDVDWSSAKEYLIRSRAVDNVSNIELPYNEILIMIDSEEPLSIIDYPPNTGWINQLTNITGRAVDSDGSEIDYVTICIRDKSNDDYWTGITWSPEIAWLKVKGRSNWYYDCSKIPWNFDSEYQIRTSAVDFAGNMEYPGSECSFKFDLKAPRELKIQINHGEKYTNTPQVKLSLTAKDEESGVNQMSISTKKDNFQNWKIFYDIEYYDLSGDDGVKTVYFTVNDFANNTAEPVSDSIILDTTPPTNLSIMINNGTNVTHYHEVSLNLNAYDNTSGVHLMSFKLDNDNWTSWEEFSNKKKFFLSLEDGEKTIYFIVKDHVGNIAEPVSAKIVLNTTIYENNGNKTPEKIPSANVFESLPIIWILITIILIIILLLIIVLFYRRKIVYKDLPSKDAIMVKRSKLPKVIETEIQTLEQKQKVKKEPGSERVHIHDHRIKKSR